MGQDPVGLGLVASLARPSGSLTGINLFANELEAKRLELLRELVPKAARVAVLVNPPDVPNTEGTLRMWGTAARAIGLQLHVLRASTRGEIDAAFETIGRERPDALFVAASAFLNIRRIQLVQLAALHRVPASYALRESVEAGGAHPQRRPASQQAWADPVGERVQLTVKRKGVVHNLSVEVGPTGEGPRTPFSRSKP